MHVVSRTGCMLTLIDVMPLSLKNGSNFRAILRMDKFLNMDTNDINLGRGGERKREREREKEGRGVKKLRSYTSPAASSR